MTAPPTAPQAPQATPRKPSPEPGATRAERLQSALFVAFIRVMLCLPYGARVAVMGWFFAHVVGPLAGWRRRIRANLALARPDLGPREVARLARAVPDNVGRSLIEIYSGSAFTDRVRAGAPLTGPGVQALEQAASEGRPVIVACAHFGNYDALRAALAARGWRVGALYRPMNNRAFNAHYAPAISAIAEPLFPRHGGGRAGLAAMVRFLRGGGMLCLGFDQFDRHGATLRFFGLPSETVLTPAELALRHDALLVPAAGIRGPDGLSFAIRIGAPVAHGTPAAMMQALNDDLEALVRAHMDQWFWVHRRWKAPRRKPAAAGN